MTQQYKHLDLSVNISVSPCKDAETIGYDGHQINRIIIRIAQYWLYSGAKVIFGHDWREDGVMRAVGELAEIVSSNGSLHQLETSSNEKPYWRMLNIVPVDSREGLSRHAIVAEQNASDASGASVVLKVASLLEYLHNMTREMPALNQKWHQHLPANWQNDNTQKLWVLRRVLTDLLDPGIRICLGGKTEDYSGYYAGVAEEAYLALKYKKPLYLIGGFGGATRAVCAALVGKSRLPIFSEPSGLAKPTDKNPIKNMEAIFGLPVDGLESRFQDFGLEYLCRINGLKPSENLQLFETSDIEFAMDLISRGVRKTFG